MLIDCTSRSVDSSLQLEVGYYGCPWRLRRDLEPSETYNYGAANTMLYVLTKSNLFRHSGFTTVDFKSEGKAGIPKQRPRNNMRPL
jgi:hypothetical protein